ncbi:D-alanyl-D-alanine carboxypeptidase family protein [Embleya sp. NPDC055664]
MKPYDVATTRATTPKTTKAAAVPSDTRAHRAGDSGPARVPAAATRVTDHVAGSAPTSVQVTAALVSAPAADPAAARAAAGSAAIAPATATGPGPGRRASAKRRAALAGRRRSLRGPAALVVGALLALVAGCADDSGPATRTAPVTATVSATDGDLTLQPDWPKDGQAALSVDGARTPLTSGTAKPTPTASVAKVMTAYVFLKAKPLAAGSSGPSFTISAEEAARSADRLRRSESLTPITAGETFTQRRALEALMVVSANNIAHEIARWVDGGDAAFVARMNRTARELGMTNTTYTDPSGYDPATVSTAADQVKLFGAAMRDPGFASIAGVPSYTDSARATKPNGNSLLGRDGVVAGKTGFTTPAGANLVFAAERQLNGRKHLIIGAVMSQHRGKTAAAAISESEKLLTSVGKP